MASRTFTVLRRLHAAPSAPGCRTYAATTFPLGVGGFCGRSISKRQQAGFRRPAGIAERASAAADGSDPGASAAAAGGPDHGALLSAEEFAEAGGNQDGGSLAASSVAADLEALAADRDLTEAAVEAMGDTREWKGYDAHVAFEMNLVRAQYVGDGDTPLTDARRAQLSAHLGAVRKAVMEEHADAAADAFVAGLGAEEEARLRALARQLQDGGVRFDALLAAAEDGGVPQPSMGLQDSMAQFTEMVSGLEAASAGGSVPSDVGPSSAAMAVALEDIAKDLGMSSKADLMARMREGEQAAPDGSTPGRTGR